MNHVAININREARRMGMSIPEFKQSCNGMVKLGLLKEIRDRNGNVYLKLSTPDDSMNADLDEMCHLLKLV